MEAYAQTNIQLFNQMRRLGSSREEMLRMRRTYEMVMALIPCTFTGAGKSTLTHHVGVASIALRHGAPFDVALAAMAHGAYIDGDWGTWLRRPTAAKRARLRAVVGERAEAAVFRFLNYVWTPPTIAALADRAADLDDAERDVVMVRIFDMVDYLSEDSAFYFYRSPEAMRAFVDAAAPGVVRIADTLGLAALAREFESLAAGLQTLELPDVLCRLQHPNGPPIVLWPGSVRRRTLLYGFQAVTRRVRRVLDGLGSLGFPAR